MHARSTPARCFALVCFLGSSLLVSCASHRTQPGGSNERPRGALVARVGDSEIHEDDVQRAMEREPAAARSRYQQPAARRELIEGLVRFELLAQAAEKAGLTRDPDALHALKQIAVTKFVNGSLQSLPAPEALPKTAIEASYAAHQATEYTRPEAVQVRHIRVTDLAAAARIAAQAQALNPADDRGFAALAASTSEDTLTRLQGGDLGFIDTHSRLPSPLVEAALALRTPGQVSQPVATELGYEILRLVSRRSAAVSPLGDVEEGIRQRLYKEGRSKALDQLLERLRQSTPVEIVASAPR